jgi:hypothetical protein
MKLARLTRVVGKLTAKSGKIKTYKNAMCALTKLLIAVINTKNSKHINSLAKI